jgi:hypothetical protein
MSTTTSSSVCGEHLFKALHILSARLLVVHYRVRIVSSNHTASALLHLQRRFPGTVDVLRRIPRLLIIIYREYRLLYTHLNIPGMAVTAIHSPDEATNA